MKGDTFLSSATASRHIFILFVSRMYLGSNCDLPVLKML